MDYLWAVLLLLGLAVGWVLTLFSMPGNWLMVALAGLYAWLGPAPEERVAIGWPVVFVLLGLAVVGEALEFAASALGARKGGGSKRGALLAVVGSFVGSIVGGFVGLPFLPTIIGAVVGVVIFAALGALGGAMLGEYWKGRSFDESLTIGRGAFWGRIIGTVAKMCVASAMAVIAAFALVLK